MKMNSAVIVSLLTGLLGGFLVGAFLGNKQASEEFEDALRASEERCDRLEEDLSIERDKHQKALDLINGELDAVERKTKPNLDDLVRNYNVNPSPAPDDIPERVKCFEITREEYDNDYSFDSEASCMIFYPVDGVMVNERDETIPIPDVEDLIGDNCMERIISASEDELFFRNEDLNTIYEVVIEHGMSYERDILGYEEALGVEEKNRR